MQIRWKKQITRIPPSPVFSQYTQIPLYFPKIPQILTCFPQNTPKYSGIFAKKTRTSSVFYQNTPVDPPLPVFYGNSQDTPAPPPHPKTKKKPSYLVF